MIFISLLTSSNRLEEWKLRFYHIRYEADPQVVAETRATMERCPIGDHVHGLAVCKKGDKFVKEVGRRRALTSLLRRAGFTKGERGQIWEQYFERA